MTRDSGLQSGDMLKPGSLSIVSECDIAANALLKRYGLSNCTIEQICYSENHTYRVNRQNEEPVATLRICRPGYRSLKELQAEIDWLSTIDHIVELDGFEIIKPLPALDGSCVQVVALPSGAVLHGVAFAYMSGSAPDERDEAAMRGLFRRLGSLAAALHEHAQGLGAAAAVHEHALGPGSATAARASLVPPIINRPVWDCDSALGSNAPWGSWRDFAGFTSRERELLECAEARIRCVMDAYGKPLERFGLIHADMRLANLLVEGDTLKLLDFDDCAYGWHLFDLAASLSFIETRPDVPDLIDSWLEGYRAVSTLRPLEDADLAVIPSLIMLRRLQLTAWLATRHDSDPVEGFSHEWAKDTIAVAGRYMEGHLCLATGV